MGNNFIIGSKDEVSVACSKSFGCESFQYTESYEVGALCSRGEIVVGHGNMTGDEQAIEICSLDPGKNSPNVNALYYLISFSLLFFNELLCSFLTNRRNNN